MDIDIHTSDPDEIDVDEIRQALEGLNYFVDTITVHPR